MKDVANKIRLNNKLWFTVLGNKIVFGDNDDISDCHYTISFGNLSGYFDLHLTNEKLKTHFTVFKISHQNVAECIPLIFDKIVHSVLELEPVDNEKLFATGTTVYQFSELGDVLTEFAPLVKKDKLIIDKDSDDFKVVVDKLVAKSVASVVDPGELNNLSAFTGLLKTSDDVGIIAKNQIIGDQIFRLKNIDLDINSVIEKVLGTETYLSIIDRINEGVTTLKEKE